MDCPDRQHDACANVTFVGKTKDGIPITSTVRGCAALEGQNVGCTTTKADLGNTTICTCQGDLCNMVCQITFKDFGVNKTIAVFN